VELALDAVMNMRLQRLYVYPQHGYWGLLRRNVVVTAGSRLELQRIDLGHVDALRHF
jgi:subtilisin